MQRSGRWIFTILILLFLLGFAILWWLLQDNNEETLPPVPTIRPTEVVDLPSETPTASPEPPTATRTATASATATITQTVTLTQTSTPSAQPSPTVIAETPAPALPPIPASVEVAITGEIAGSGITPTYGRFGGLYDNQPLLDAGHIMITVPADATLPTFHIDVFEVSNLQLVTYLNASNLTQTPLPGWTYQNWIGDSQLRQNAAGQWMVGNPRNDYLPVYGVSGLTARAYCENIGGSLPTLEQWQKAAFWVQDQAPRPYPWGDAPLSTSFANFDSDGTMARTALDAGRSWVGVFHMAGNVAEWVQIDAQTFGVVGGSYLDSAADFDARLQTVQIVDASQPIDGAGFRCVRNN